MLISLVAIVDENMGLGKDNQLLCYLPADLQHFKSVTMGKPIIMGRKTYESIGKPLPGRMNIVLSHESLSIDGVHVVSSLEAALEITQHEPEVMIIGGASIYEQAIQLAHQIYLTVIHHQFEADVHFPLFNKSTWNCVSRLKKERDEKNKFDMTFCRYLRK